MHLFLDIFTKVFFILSPFFSVSMFLLLTAIAAQIIFSGVQGFLHSARP